MLARLRASREQNDEGFTLIELLVVIIIIGILAAVAIPVFLNQRKKGYQASMKADLRTVAQKMESYFTDTLTYLGAAGFATVNASITGTGVIGTDPVTLSAGNTITLKGAGVNGFCLQAQSVKSSGVSYFYDSQNGGLLPASAVGCVATSF